MNNKNVNANPPLWNYKTEIPKLTNLAFRALDLMYDKKSRLFVFNWDRNKRKLGPISERYSAIAAIGLQSAKLRGIDIPFSVSEILKELLCRINAMEERGPGDLALLLWAFSLLYGEIEEKVMERLIPDKKVNVLIEELRKRPVVEAAWTLSAFSYLYKNGFRNSLISQACESIADIIIDAFNQETHIFSYVSKKQGFKKILGYHREFGNFASQSYSIYGLSTYYQATGDDRALKVALNCSNKICSLQGPHGQFWWIYNVRRGTIADKYPVFSVHQDGMGPMALKKLSIVSKRDYSDFIEKSFDWLYGNNEMGISMILWEEGIILRCVQRKAPLSELSYYLNMVRSRFHLPSVKNDNQLALGGLEILNETRPYHMGWMLVFFYDS
ncbi:MAG: hypothetical protein ACUVXA_14790 [Candidatus Jordarchaeum sp.]|uniref:hypothetical protein n=1 Tax=Candidatus Jordarchaeum sp. TaxID=2823881 RepID=UPI00404B8E12